jgi:hypothetical protein
MTGSSNVGQVQPSSAFDYAVSLRVRHPTMNLQMLGEALSLEPVHSWTAGDPRRSQSGSPLGGQHRDSYWSASLPALLSGPNALPLELFLSQQLMQLGRRRELLNSLQAEGGEVSLLIELEPVSNATLTLSSAMSRKLADLNIEVEFQFLGD